MKTTSPARRKDRAFLARASPAEDFELRRGEGSHAFDARGRKYVDFLMGWCVGNLGWGNREVRAKVRGAKGPDYVYPYYLYAPWGELAELLARIAPGALRRSFRATGGTEAVEIALQVAMTSTKRRQLVSLEGSYHGNSLGTLSIGSSDNRKQYPQLLPNCRKLEPPLDEAAAGRLETLLKRRDVAAFVMEPVVVNLGVLVPSAAFMARAQALCRRYGTLFVADEVATGFGRTGRLFAAEHFDLEPDVMCLGKAITGGYGGMGATIVTEKVYRSLGGDLDVYSTYGWHPLAVEAALANIRYLTRHAKRLLADVAATSGYFQERLSQMEFAGSATVRIKGLAIAIELARESYAAQIEEKARRAGLLLAAEGERLMLFPALNVDRETARQGLDILAECL